MRKPSCGDRSIASRDFLPSGAELSSYLIEQCAFPEKNEKYLEGQVVLTLDSANFCIRHSMATEILSGSQIDPSVMMSATM